MKKLAALFLPFAFILSLFTGCKNNTSPSDEVKNYFSRIQQNATVDNLKEAASSYCNIDINNDYDDLVQIVLDNFKSMEITPTSEKIDGDSAVVNVSVKGISYKKIITNYIKEASAQYIFNSSPKDFLLETKNILIKDLKNAEIEERTGKINLKKSSKGWEIITDDSNFIYVITGMTESELKNIIKN